MKPCVTHPWRCCARSFAPVARALARCSLPLRGEAVNVRTMLRVRPVVRARWATILVLVSLLLPSSSLSTPAALAYIGPCTPVFSAVGSPFISGGSPRSVVVGSFNSGDDALLDIAVANKSSNNVAIGQGNGAGAFTQVGASLI